MITACLGKSGLPLPSPFPTLSSSPTLDEASRATRIAAGFTPTLPPTQTPFPLVTLTATPEPETSQFDTTNPITGEALPPGTVFSRPLLVKLANWPEAVRPAVGLNQADMVFEYYLGHQMNHLLALYLTSSAEKVGPATYARLPDKSLTELYQANLAANDIENTVELTLKTNLTSRYAKLGFAPCPGICADFSREQEMTVVNPSAMKAYFKAEQGDLFISNLGVNSFAQFPSSSSEPGEIISVEYADFSVMQWRYNEGSTLYELWQDHRKPDGKYELLPAFDGADAFPIAFENIIVVYSKYIEYTSTSYDIILKPDAIPGQALFFRDGRVTFGRWQIKETNQPIQFQNQDGSLYGLKPGSTWIVFVTAKSKSNQSAPGEWQIAFSIK